MVTGDVNPKPTSQNKSTRTDGDGEDTSKSSNEATPEATSETKPEKDIDQKDAQTAGGDHATTVPPKPGSGKH